MKSLNKTKTQDSHFLIRSVFFVSKGNLFDVLFYYTVAGINAMWQGLNDTLTSP